MQPTSLRTLEQIAAGLPAPDLALADAIVEHESREALVRLGAKIRSSRILTDVARIYALANSVWSDATETQKEALVGFSGELLAIAVDRAVALARLARDTRPPPPPGSPPTAEHAVAARAAFERGLVRTDHARHVLRAVAGRNAALLTRIEKAADEVHDAELLARGIQRLAKIGRQFLLSRDSKMKIRVKLARLDEAYLARLDDLAREIRRTSDAVSEGPPLHGTLQERIDFLDGINLVLLSLIVHAFESAHHIDPSIPRLVPVATRRLIGRGGAVFAAAVDRGDALGEQDEDDDDGEGQGEDADAGGDPWGV